MRRLLPIGACVLVLVVAGCGGGGNSAEDQIKSAYTSFFSSKGSLTDHVALMENGAQFAPVIKSFLNNPLAKGVSASVSSVTMQGPKKAKVVYTVKISLGSLSNQTGYAVLEGGTWKVADVTLCGLVMLTGSTPSACKS
jgi:hypothetical protein